MHATYKMLFIEQKSNSWKKKNKINIINKRKSISTANKNKAANELNGFVEFNKTGAAHQ